jgi:mannose-6-phosphate isomerase-like protein (cupin superfamily)
MSINLEGGCRVSQLREGEPLVVGTARVWQRIGRETGAKAISLRVIECAPGLSPGFRNDDCDEVLYLLDGFKSEDQAGDVRATLILDGTEYDVGPDTGVYIRPGVTFAVNNRGSEKVLLAGAQCPEPHSAPPFVEVPASAGRTDPNEPDPIVRLADRPSLPTADRWYRVLVDDEIGSTQVTQFVGSIPPGRAPDHFHNYEEVLVILKGEGRMWAGQSNTPIAPGSCIYLPKGQIHCVENTGTGELRLLGVFYPAGSPSVRYDA